MEMGDDSRYFSGTLQLILSSFLDAISFYLVLRSFMIFYVLNDSQQYKISRLRNVLIELLVEEFHDTILPFFFIFLSVISSIKKYIGSLV